jgi:hypothetical protein
MTGTGTVTRHWGTRVVIDQIAVDGFLAAGVGEAAGSPGPRVERIDPDSVITDPEALKREFLASFNTLAEGADTAEVTDVELRIEVWRAGHDLPHTGFAADYVGWCFLAASPAPEHTESGAVSVADPRAGSAMTAMPGLPWGRQVMIRPVPGAHLAVPGWLTCSVVPVEERQYAVVAFASSAR